MLTFRDGGNNMTTLAELRKKKDLTQEQLANALNISISAVAMYETGARIPRLRRAKQIAEFFQVPIHEINFFDLDTHVTRAKTAGRESA
jgi:transcriptional regulator with XRE-family HTH domain